MSDEELTAKQLHEFDQGWSASRELFEGLVSDFILFRDDDADKGVPEPVSIVGMAVAMARNLDPEQLSSALAFIVATHARERGSV